jgi:ABC-type bacteriocin/lantibiotic exporter with double-glycine peptidase domain
LLPIYQQEQPASCVAACVRMALAALGHTIAEVDIRKRCGQSALGLSLTDIPKGLADLPIVVTVHKDWGLDDLRDETRQAHYPIVGIDLRPLDGRFAYHAVVIAKVESNKITVHNPEPGQNVQELNPETFMAVWKGADQQVLMIVLKK